MIAEVNAMKSVEPRSPLYARLGARQVKSVAGAFVALALLAFAAPAQAQKKGGNVITIGEVTIVGRVQKPIASVDVSKIQPKLTLAELRQPFLDRIEVAVGKDPF
jgi:hypothetical protein